MSMEKLRDKVAEEAIGFDEREKERWRTGRAYESVHSYNKYQKWQEKEGKETKEEQKDDDFGILYGIENTGLNDIKQKISKSKF